MGTTITTSEGKAVDGKTVEMKWKMTDSTTGNLIDFRNLVMTVDADHFTIDMYATKRGEEWKGASVSYSRTK